MAMRLEPMPGEFDVVVPPAPFPSLCGRYDHCFELGVNHSFDGSSPYK